MKALRILILGGTTESGELARLIAGDPRFDATVSLAGATRTPAAPPIPHRVGGFGGIEGLADYLACEAIDCLVDATHPFAARISRNAAQAAEMTGLFLLAIRRPPWVSGAGDDWRHVPDAAAAARALGARPRTVFLTLGRKDLAPFRDAPHHRYLLRSVDPPPDQLVPPQAEILTARGPFSVGAERELMRARGIDILVTKNSGGAATAAKLEAARVLGIPVVMMARPDKPGAPAVATAGEAFGVLCARHDAVSVERRGV